MSTITYEEYENIEKETDGNADVKRAWKILTADKKKTFVVVQFSTPSRISIGEWFGLARGEDGIGKVVTALRALGVDAVVDTAIAEDAMATYEAANVWQRRKKGITAPYISTRCDAFAEVANELLVGLDVPQMLTASEMSARLVKEYYAEKCAENTPEKKVRVIAIEPCKARKSSFYADVVLTTEELAGILADATINAEVSLRLLKKGALDTPLGKSSACGYLTGKRGGAAEAVARCLLADKSETALRKLSYSGFYGNKGRAEAVVKDGETEWRFAVVQGLKKLRALIEDVKNGAARYDYVEVVTCEGGCVCGDGQLSVCGDVADGRAAGVLRAAGLTALAQKCGLAAANENFAVSEFTQKWERTLREKGLGWDDEDDEDEVDEDVREVASVVLGRVRRSVDEPQETKTVALKKEPAEELRKVEPIEEVVEEIVEEPVEEVVEEIVEEPAEEVVEEIEDEPIEEVVEEIVEEPIEEVIEVIVDEPIEEVVKEIEEEPVEEVVEEIVEEPIEEVVEESVDEPIEEVVEEIVDEPVEEVVEETVKKDEPKQDPYYRRMSNRDRRKMKRLKKEGKWEQAETKEVVTEAPIKEIAEEVEEQPIVEVEPAVEEQPIVEVEPAVEEQPIVEVEPAVEKQPIVEVEPAVEEQPIVEVEPAVEEQPIVAEEVAEESAEVIVEETFEETTETVENTTEEVVEKQDPYHTRLSGRDRRKMKRKKNGNK